MDTRSAAATMLPASAQTDVTAELGLVEDEIAPKLEEIEACLALYKINCVQARIAAKRQRAEVAAVLRHARTLRKSVERIDSILEEKVGWVDQLAQIDRAGRMAQEGLLRRLKRLEDAAAKSAGLRVARGLVPDQPFDFLLRRLSSLYESRTGKKAGVFHDTLSGRYGGPFFRFARVCLAHTPKASITDAALAKAIQRALKPMDKKLS
jgi:hypothetical protein